MIRPVACGEALPAGTRLTLFSDEKPDRFFTVIKFWMDKTSGVALDLKTGVPTYQVEDEEGRTHLLIHLPRARRRNLTGLSASFAFSGETAAKKSLANATFRIDLKMTVPDGPVPMTRTPLE